MATPGSRLKVKRDGEVTRIAFTDRNILEEASIQQIGDEVARLIEATNNPKLLISFENVEHLSSAALGALITINNKVRHKGGQLRLSNIDAQIYEVFVITRLNKLFQIFPDNEQAIASFK
ncbi:MAG: STAS domain-containing protein [Phycisphaera sp.]|nr:STAS domain-containing protein [Phycisphaera sp.]